MLKLQADKMQKAIERAKAEHLKVRIINADKREYGVKTYTVRFVVKGAAKFGECSCKGGQAGMYCKHLAAAAQANILCQAFRQSGAAEEPSVETMAAFVTRQTGWMI